MNKEADELILEKCYLKLSVNACEKSKNRKHVSCKDDKVLANGINKKFPTLFDYISKADIQEEKDLLKKLINAKSIYMQFYYIKGRNPGCVTDSMDEKMKQLIHIVAKEEAKLLLKFRKNAKNGDEIDLNLIFENKSNLNKLGNVVAHNIVKTAIRQKSLSVDAVSATYFITKTGHKYHTRDCPFCKGRKLIPTTRRTVNDKKLTACKCFSLKNVDSIIDSDYVTVFIDEAIRSVKWDEDGEEGNVGSYSFIICSGKLTSENKINETNYIDDEVGYIKEKTHVERIAETTIGKVMTKLIVNYNFSKNLRIYTDNKSASEKWKMVGGNSRLSEFFESVTVNFIPREQNKMADKLGREKVVLCIPESKYKELEEGMATYDIIRENERKDALMAEKIKESLLEIRDKYAELVKTKKDPFTLGMARRYGVKI